MSRIDSELTPEEEAAANDELKRLFDEQIPPETKDRPLGSRARVLIFRRPDNSGFLGLERRDDAPGDGTILSFTETEELRDPRELGGGGTLYHMSGAGELVTHKDGPFPRKTPDKAIEFAEVIKNGERIEL